MELILAAFVGIGLSAACGFRVFIPLLGLSIASHSGHVQLAEGFEWLGSNVGLVTLSFATLLEVSAYYVPWLDNLMDSITTPAAIVAGTMVSASMMTEMSPMLQWSLAAVAGGGLAGAVQTATVLVRGSSTATTGGLANPVVSTGELAVSTGITLVAILVPLVAIIVVLASLFFIARFFYRRAQAKKPALICEIIN
jgi:hypothetical protein